MDKNKKFLIKCRAIILHGGKMLVVRHKESNFVALPGGHLEYGEDLKESLKREIIEELGVEPEISRLLYINTYQEKGLTQYVEFFFEVTNGDKYLDVEKLNRTHAHELAEIVWISSSDNVHFLPKKLKEDFQTGKIISDELRYLSDFE